MLLSFPRDDMQAAVHSGLDGLMFPMGLSNDNGSPPRVRVERGTV